MGGGSGNLQVSQGYEVLPLKGGKAYPIPCEEWDHIKAKLNQMKKGPWLYSFLGSTLLGASLATFITILTGSFSCNPQSNTLVVAWAVVVVSLVCGIAALFFAKQQEKVELVQVTDVLPQMELVEKRYDHGTA